MALGAWGKAQRARDESALRLSSTSPTISAGQLARRADLK
jgi:hypothetical protein